MNPLNRWEPFRTTSGLESQVNRIFNELFDRSQESNLTSWAPAVDIFENEHELVVKADLPDVKPEDLDIRVENNILTIRGERKFEKEEKDKKYHRIERSYGNFLRSFTLPDGADGSKVNAEFKDGVLALTIPKREEAKPKQIKVSVGTQAAAATAR